MRRTGALRTVRGEADKERLQSVSLAVVCAAWAHSAPEEGAHQNCLLRRNVRLEGAKHHIVLFSRAELVGTGRKRKE